MRHRFARAMVIVGLVAGLNACTTPATGGDSQLTGERRVVELVLEAASALPPSARWTPPTRTGTVTCRRHFLGYAIGSTGTRRAEVPLVVTLPADVAARSLLAPVVARWHALGYDVDRSGLSDRRFPKVRATAPGGYEVVATAFTELPQIDLYAVSRCLRSR